PLKPPNTSPDTTHSTHPPPSLPSPISPHHQPPSYLFFLMLPPPPISTLFPYTTLFRSRHQDEAAIPDCLELIPRHRLRPRDEFEDRKSTRLNSSHVEISYAVFCLKKKKKKENV